MIFISRADVAADVVERCHVATCVHARWQRMCTYLHAHVCSCVRVRTHACNLWVKHPFQDIS